MDHDSKLLNIQALQILTVVAETFEGTEVEAKAAVASCAGPLDEGHAFTLFVTHTSAKITWDLDSRPVGAEKGTNIVYANCTGSLHISCCAFVAEGTNVLGKMLGSRAILAVGTDAAVAGVGDGLLFGLREHLSGGEHF